MTLSSSTLFLRLGILPSILVASVALSACQDSISTHEQKKKEVTKSIHNKANNSATSFDDASTDESMVNNLTAEQKMAANLSNYRWTLTSVTNNKAQPLSTLTSIKDQVRLSFNQYQGQNTLSYSVGCNTISAAYQLKDSVLMIEDSMSTKMSCGALDAAENDLIELMQGDSQLVLTENNQEDSPVLTQLTNEATTLVWEGSLTAQAKYNSKGDTIFWAVNAKKIPCNTNTAEMCLQVKPITYDEQGIKSSEGKWAPFAGVIEGYQHSSEQNEVLRLQRYQLDNNAGASQETSTSGAKSYAYVLDAVIESSLVE